MDFEKLFELKSLYSKREGHDQVLKKKEKKRVNRLRMFVSVKSHLGSDPLSELEFRYLIKSSVRSGGQVKKTRETKTNKE